MFSTTSHSIVERRPYVIRIILRSLALVIIKLFDSNICASPSIPTTMLQLAAADSSFEH